MIVAWLRRLSRLIPRFAAARPTSQVRSFRPSGRVNGSRQISPMTSEMKPGSMRKSPPIITSTVSASSPVGIRPSAKARRNAAQERRPSRWANHAPRSEVASMSPIVGQAPIRRPVAMRTATSAMGRAMIRPTTSQTTQPLREDPIALLRLGLAAPTDKVLQLGQAVTDPPRGGAEQCLDDDPRAHLRLAPLAFHELDRNLGDGEALLERLPREVDLEVVADAGDLRDDGAKGPRAERIQPSRDVLHVDPEHEARPQAAAARDELPRLRPVHDTPARYVPRALDHVCRLEPFEHRG